MSQSPPSPTSALLPPLDVQVTPHGLRGTLQVPGDKSISHRSLMFSALTEGPCEVRGLLPSADVLSTKRCLEQVGIRFEALDEPSGHWRIYGKPTWDEPTDVLDCGNSGTTIRLLSGLIAGQNQYAVMTGDKSLVKRPMGRVIQPLSQMGATWTGRQNATRAPITLIPTETGLRGIAYTMPVASAQVKSAVLLAGLFAQGETRVREPLPSRDHTERMLQAMGADLAIASDGEIRLAEYQHRVLRPTQWQVPGDASSAAFPLIAALLCPGSNIRIQDVGLNPQRTGLFETLRKAGVPIAYEQEREQGGEPIGDVHVRAHALKGDITLEAADIPAMVDEIPILAVACCWLEGTLRVRGAEELRKKESDRLLAVATEFAKLGIHVKLFEDGLSLTGNPDLCLPEAPMVPLSAWHDHRIAMALAVMNLIHNQRNPQQACLWPIDDTDIVNVSFPGFYGLMNRLQAPESAGA
jgi:3-phosphoshikimate 1-carboxyvinyltransferase